MILTIKLQATAISLWKGRQQSKQSLESHTPLTRLIPQTPATHPLFCSFSIFVPSVPATLYSIASMVNRAQTNRSHTHAQSDRPGGPRPSHSQTKVLFLSRKAHFCCLTDQATEIDLTRWEVRYPASAKPAPRILCNGQVAACRNSIMLGTYTWG